ncbi:hypothetical protein lse_0386 [Listeria seeligeri serovar 1/2b str. SLCC3954]|nr:hypothetical protein lse_0386 [Listeria seeligeri serovar 1/2b str. SLCC3954]
MEMFFSTKIRVKKYFIMEQEKLALMDFLSGR